MRHKCCEPFAFVSEIKLVDGSLIVTNDSLDYKSHFTHTTYHDGLSIALIQTELCEVIGFQSS